jgi:hypothetical protein
MEIKEEHKPLLKKLGLSEEDFPKFDGKWVSYEYDEQKGVRIYDPNYETSYNEYLDADGWSAWSSEEDTFMKDILRGVPERVRDRESISPRPEPEEISDTIRKKFDRKIKKSE